MTLIGTLSSLTNKKNKFTEVRKIFSYTHTHNWFALALHRKIISALPTSEKPVPSAFILFLAAPFNSTLCELTSQLPNFTDGKECSTAFLNTKMY
jgi:hypothetical protein